MLGPPIRECQLSDHPYWYSLVIDPGQKKFSRSGQFFVASVEFGFVKFHLKITNFSNFFHMDQKKSLCGVIKYPGQRQVGYLFTAVQKYARSGPISSTFSGTSLSYIKVCGYIKNDALRIHAETELVKSKLIKFKLEIELQLVEAKLVKYKLEIKLQLLELRNCRITNS